MGSEVVGLIEGGVMIRGAGDDRPLAGKGIDDGSAASGGGVASGVVDPSVEGVRLANARVNSCAMFVRRSSI